MIIEKYKKQNGKPMFDGLKTPSIKNSLQVPLTKAEHVKKITANENLLNLTALDKSVKADVKFK